VGESESELGAVYRREMDYVWQTLQRLGVPTRDRPDVMHDVFVVVHTKWADYDRARPLRPWLFGIAFRVALGWKRRRARTDVFEDHSEREDDVMSPEDRAALGERWSLAMHGLLAMPLERRVVFIRHCMEGASVVEVAAELGIPVNTAYSRLRLAREDFTRAVAPSRVAQVEEELADV
jgi:RNA polymerase sigma-70 factor, ECF subfamily